MLVPLHPSIAAILLLFGSLKGSCNHCGDSFSKALPDTCPHCEAKFNTFYDPDHPCYGGPNANESSGKFLLFGLIDVGIYHDAAVCTECGKHVVKPLLHRLVKDEKFAA